MLSLDYKPIFPVSFPKEVVDLKAENKDNSKLA